MLILQNRGCEDQIRTFALRLKQIKRSTKNKKTTKNQICLFFKWMDEFYLLPWT